MHVKEIRKGLGLVPRPFKAVGNMDDVGHPVDFPAEPHHIPDVHAAVHTVLCRHAQFQNHVFPNAFPHRFQDHFRKTGAVFHTSAEFIGPVVGPG